MRFAQAFAVGFLILGLIVGAFSLSHPVKAVLGQWLLERAFAAGGAEPWPGADMRPVARLSIERLKVALIVMDRASGKGFGQGAKNRIHDAEARYSTGVSGGWKGRVTETAPNI